MNKDQITNPLEAIRGRVPGLTIQRGTNGPAALDAVRLRGTTSLTSGNDPLIIVDGVFGDLSMLTSIYPTDIESFTILKDASETAQYGSRGASGVIEITTKNQPAYANAKLVEDDFHFDKESQTFSVYTNPGSDYHTIIVELAGGNVSAEQLVKEIKAQAQGSIFQNVSDVYNTRIGDVFEGNLTAETVNDLFIIVTSGDGKTTTQYAVQIMQ